MPLTLPSHAAAVLPLMRPSCRALPPAALVVGATAPDLSYALGHDAGLAHTFGGALVMGVPVALVTWLWAELLLLPALARTLPCVRGVQLARFARTRGLPQDVRGWAWGVVALALGALSHVLWDGFTHDSLLPARQLYAEVRPPGLPFRMTLATLFQHLSTVGGALLVGQAMVRAYPRLAPATPAAPQRFLPYLGLVLLAAALQCFRELRWLAPGTSPFYVLWLGFWACTRGALVACTAVALLERLLARRESLSTA